MQNKNFYIKPNFYIDIENFRILYIYVANIGR